MKEDVLWPEGWSDPRFGRINDDKGNPKFTEVAFWLDGWPMRNNLSWKDRGLAVELGTRVFGSLIEENRPEGRLSSHPRWEI